jgi:hypothetical protein
MKLQAALPPMSDAAWKLLAGSFVAATVLFWIAAASVASQDRQVGKLAIEPEKRDGCLSQGSSEPCAHGASSRGENSRNANEWAVNVYC